LINYSYLLLQEFYMLNKKILAAAIAATLSQSVFAVDLDLTTIVPAKFSSETVAGSTLTTGKAFEIKAGGTELGVDAKVGFGFTKSTSFYVRYDLTGAVFQTAKASGNLTLAGAVTPTVTLAQGGGEDANFVIFEYVDAGAAVAATQVLTLANVDLALSGTGNASVAMSVYANAPDAVNKTGALVTKSGAFVSQVSAITTAFTANSPVADVDAGFTDFVGDKTEGSLGSVKLTLNTAALSAASGIAVTRAEVITDGTSTFVVTGDFSTALTAGKGGVTLDTVDTCANAGTAMTVNTGGTTATLTGTATLADTVEIFVCLKPDPAVTIAATDAFSATLTAKAGSAGTLAAQTSALGAITRNGTTLEIPYITTFADYNQRLIMTNTAATATTYSCTFTPEAGVTATAGSAASGSIAGKTSVVVKATDLVTLTGGSRTAARCTLLSQSTNIDSATTIVNLADKSTDTVTIN
jgi:hypothetical protein